MAEEVVNYNFYTVHIERIGKPRFGCHATGKLRFEVSSSVGEDPASSDPNNNSDATNNEGDAPPPPSPPKRQESPPKKLACFELPEEHIKSIR